MFNKVILVGNLTRDPELKYLPSGSAVCSTSLAVNKKYKAQDGSQKEDVCFIDIAFFGRTAEIANQYLSRGKKILIEGRLKFDQWTDQNGVKRSRHSVTVDTLQMLDTKDETQEKPPVEYMPPSKDGAIPESHANKDICYDEDEIPF